MTSKRLEQLGSGNWVEFMYERANEDWALTYIKLPRRTFNVMDFEEIYTRFCDAQHAEPVTDDCE